MIKKIKTIKVGRYFLLMVFSVLFMLVGCDKEEPQQDLNEYVAKLKQDTAKMKKKKSLPLLVLPTSVTYQEENLREPFQEKESLAGKKSTLSNPLHDYSLSALRFVGVLLKNDVVFAFVLAPDNKIYQIKTGDLIGDHDGKVEKIENNQLEIIEQDVIVTLQLKDESQ